MGIRTSAITSPIPRFHGSWKVCIRTRNVLHFKRDTMAITRADPGFLMGERETPTPKAGANTLYFNFLKNNY